MAKTKKISINAFDKIKKETYTPTEIFEWNSIEVEVKKTLSFKEVLEFVDSVVKSCFSVEDGSYFPEVKDFAVRACILEKYANFTLPNNTEHKYELIYGTNVIDEILMRVNHQQFNEMLAAINAKITHLSQANIEAVNKQMNELYSAYDTIQKQLEAMFAGINPDEFTQLLGIFSNTQTDGGKLAQSYIGQVKAGE